MGQSILQGSPTSLGQAIATTQAASAFGLGFGLSADLGMNLDMTEGELQIMQDIGLDLGGEMEMDFGDGGASLNL